MFAARDEIDKSKGAGLSQQLEDCLGLGLSRHDIDANALVLATRDMSMQLDDMARQVQVELVGMGERHSQSMVLVDTGAGSRVTTLGCLACEWISQLSDLRELSSQLRDHSCVLRYGNEKIATDLGDDAGQTVKMLAIGLGLGDSLGRRCALGMSVDWVTWLLKLIRTCSMMIAGARQLGQGGGDLDEIEAVFSKVNEALGAKVLGELVRGIVDGHESEWKYLAQLHEVARGALTWVHLLAGREYDTKGLRDQALQQGDAQAVAATKVLAKSMDDDAKASSAVVKALGSGGDLLEGLAAAHPQCASELRKLREPAALLGPLPQWEAAGLAAAKQGLGIEESPAPGA